MTEKLSDKIEATFAILEAAAAKGERCPTSAFPGHRDNVPSTHMGALARAGRIFIEIGTHNWRQITILTGPHKGAKTKRNPMKLSRVYKTIGAEGTKLNGKLQESTAKRVQPSMPSLKGWGER